MTNAPKTLSDRVRARAQHMLDALGQACHRAGIHPDWVSTAGFVIVVGGALLAALGWLTLAGWVIALGTLLDALDGAVARARGQANPFGAVLDSTLDRYADGFIFGSIGYYFASSGHMSLLAAALLVLVGSYNVSYVRARANNPDAGVTVTVGWFSRFERVVMVVLGLWFHEVLLGPGLWLLAAGTNLTALQRLIYTRRQLED